MSDDTSNNQLNEPMMAYGAQPNLFATVLGQAVRQFNGMGSQELLKISRQGLPKRGLMALAKRISLTIQEFSNIMHISERTLQRYDDDAIIKTEYAEKAVELARLYTRGEEVFGSLEKFKTWMKTPLYVFSGEAPVSLLDTSVGFDIVFKELGRIEHGIFA
ncbi:antitoxin Xre/MbcA/ParS toxin-binding domain-containing protein [Mucilaginibacter sp. dw_454]|uniref:type II RES/Xre toxin-antitoxin system antitoxin n=1 Tax=Mucilaginibacter sp. dw_454 TaxID=2720079 RepID=UPI001BD6195C|nr:antitoxin Xre/MbcA/ParS toxin-binding domain-containing protein [Mucilaginibacter sp. dw_454]